jgi:hypothetical protein
MSTSGAVPRYPDWEQDAARVASHRDNIDKREYWNDLPYEKQMLCKCEQTHVIKDAVWKVEKIQFEECVMAVQCHAWNKPHMLSRLGFSETTLKKGMDVFLAIREDLLEFEKATSDGAPVSSQPISAPIVESGSSSQEEPEV